MLSIDKFGYTKFIKELKNIDIWKIYFDIGSFIANIDNLQDNDKQKVIDTFRFINSKNMTFDQIKKELKTK